MALCSGDELPAAEAEAHTFTVAPFNSLVPSNEGVTMRPPSCNNFLTDALNSALQFRDSDASPPSTELSPSSTEQSPLSTDTFFNFNSESTVESEKSSRSSSPKNGIKNLTALPPCRVCGDTSSGFHYGAYSCEACKVFYRRSLKKTVPYKCKKGGNCPIVPNKRLTCSSCRLEKCAAVGMSKQSIKRGRYTLEKRTDCIREVKELQKQKEDGFHDSGNESDFIMEKSPAPPVQDMSLLFDEVIKKLCANSDKFNSYSKEILDNIETSHAKHLEDLKAIEEVFGPLRLLSQEEYNDLYNCTGIDVDGRLTEVATHLPNLELRIQHMVSFAKALPGFKDFAIEDQISQIKVSGFDYFMLLSFAAMNVEHRLYTCACGHTRSEKELGRMISMKLVDEMFNTARHLQRLELTPEELAILKAYCILSPDRGELKERHKVEKAHDMIYECLTYYIQKHRADDEGFMGRLTSALLSIRTTTHMHDVHVLQLFKNFSTLDFPPLMLELIAS